MLDATKRRVAKKSIAECVTLLRQLLTTEQKQKREKTKKSLDTILIYGKLQIMLHNKRK